MKNGIHIYDNKEKKIVKSQRYNYVFDKKTGRFDRWGKDKDDNPIMAPGPELSDIEVSSGSCLGKCSFCYKANGKNQESHHMTLENYQNLIKSLGPILNQVALGITDCYANPDFFEMLKWTREYGVIPNYTTHGIDVDNHVVEQTKKYCGAVAVSIVNKEKSYNAIKKFTDAGMTQVNIHYMLSDQSYDKAFQIIDDISIDPRLNHLNALVILGLKKKGNAESNFNYIKDQEKINKLIDYAKQKEVRLGFDSCSSGSYFKYIENDSNREQLAQVVEPCESGLFSAYFNSKCQYFPCSFCEGKNEWSDGIDVLRCTNFIKEVWLKSDKMRKWRKTLLESTKNCDCSFKSECRSCPIYPSVTPCQPFQE